MRKSISQLNMLSSDEYTQIVSLFNDTAVDYPRDKCVHTLFEEQVLKTPDKTAVIACDRELTYQELNEQANRIAHSLIEKGIKKGDFVGFMLNRESSVFVSMLGIIKIGAIYLPIDIDYPDDRIEFMLQDCHAKFCITKQNITNLLNNEYIFNPKVTVSSDDMCYCIYTSGSTGKPKGTLIRHRNVINLSLKSPYGIFNDKICADTKRIVSISSVGFDMSILENIVALINGFTIVYANKNESMFQNEFEHLLGKYGGDFLQATPSKLKVLISDSSMVCNFKKIKHIILGGENVTAEFVSELKKYTKAKLTDAYGPTETTVWSTNAEIQISDNSDSDIVISQIKASPKTELALLTGLFNNTIVNYPDDKCVCTLFEEQALKTPDKTAVIACDRELTYQELNEQANRIAHSLIEKGAQPNDIIAFMLPRKSYLLSVMFGILKSGAAYMPIDPDYPQDRIDYMLQDSGAKFCITEDNINELLNTENASNPNIEMNSDNLCYCIYTSGSTGKPKGTLLTHKGVVNYIFEAENNIVVKGLLENCCKSIVSVTTVGFDIFVTESILPLLNGLAIILADESQAKIQKKLNELISKSPADVLQTTPTKMKSLIADKLQLDYLKKLKVIILGGEAVDKALSDHLHELTNAKIFNIYGPTEATVWVTNTEIK